MTGGRLTASLLPPVPRVTAAASFAAPAPPSALQAPGALFDVASLRLGPVVQRDAALDAEAAGLDDETAVQPRLEVGPVDDPYEREADAVADAVMRQPRDRRGARRQEVEEAADAESLQRKCAACAREDEVRRQELDESEEEEAVQRKCAACAEEDRIQRRSVAEAEAERGPPTLQASPATLTSGGAPLPDATRSFYEDRLGHDLSEVRLHTGAPAAERARSIDARAFTYGSHVWLGEGDASPSHTLAHELAHVLQQTQPAPLRRDAHASARTAPHVQREPYWIPTDPRLNTPTEAHDLAVEKLGEANPAFITEAPIPNAGRRGMWSPGFADLYKASRTVGVKLRSGTGRPGVPPVLQNFDEEAWWARYGFEPRRGNPQTNYDHSGDGRPYIDAATGQLEGVSQAPRSIEVGEVKSGFQSWPRLSAGRQLDRYGASLRRVAEAVNAETGAQPGWNPNPVALQARDVSFPAGFGPNSSPGQASVVRNLVFKKSRRGRSLEPDPPIDGHLIIGADPTHTGVFNYFWRPRSLPVAETLAGAASTEWRDLAQRYNALIRELQTSPKNVRRKPRRAAAKAVRRAGRRGAVRPRLQRTPRQYGADPFRHNLWERRRQTLGRSFRRYRTRHPGAFQNMEMVAWAQDSEQLMQRRMSGYRARRESGATGLRLRQFARLEFLVGLRGRMVGWLRRIFGRAYVQIARAYQRIKDRFTRRMRAPRGVGGTWVRAAFMALVKVLKVGAGIVLGRAVALLAGRIERCMDQKMEEVFAFASDQLDLSAVQERIAEIEAHQARLQQIAQSSAAQLAERFVGPYAKVFENLQTALQGFSALSSVVSLVQWGVRVAACTAPPVAGCLWNLAIGALELVLSAIMQSCWFLRKVTPYALQLGFLRQLPQKLADGLQEGLKAVFPESLHGFLCLDQAQDEVAGVQAPGENEIPCDDGPQARAPRAPQSVVDRIDELAEIDPAITREFARWAALNGVPQNTELTYEDFIAVLEHIKSSNMTPSELRQALQESAEDPEASDPIASFTREVQRRGAVTAARNRRIEERRRQREAAEAAEAAEAERSRAAEQAEEGGDGGAAQVVTAEVLDAVPSGANVEGAAPVNPQFPQGGGSQYGKLHGSGEVEPSAALQAGDPIRITLYFWIDEQWVALRNIQAEFHEFWTFEPAVMGHGRGPTYHGVTYELYGDIHFRVPGTGRIFTAQQGTRTFYLDYEGIIVHFGLVSGGS